MVSWIFSRWLYSKAVPKRQLDDARIARCGDPAEHRVLLNVRVRIQELGVIENVH